MGDLVIAGLGLLLMWGVYRMVRHLPDATGVDLNWADDFADDGDD